MVWPFFLKKKTKQFYTVCFGGVLSRVWEKRRGITCVLQQYCCIENTSNCQKWVLVFFGGVFFLVFGFFFPASERSMLRQIRVHLLRMIQRRCESEIHQHVRVNVL